MKLKVQVQTIFSVDDDQVDEFIHFHYKPFVAASERQSRYQEPYMCRAIDGWPSDSVQEFHIKREPLRDYEERRIADWLTGNGDEPSIRYLLQDQCNKGNLEPGTYMISVI